jgi:protein-tyrosine kinase
MSEPRSIGTWVREIKAGWPALVGSIVACLFLAALITLSQPDSYGAKGAVVVSPERFLQSEGTDSLPALTENVVRLSATQAVLAPAARAYVDAAPDAATRAERQRTATLSWLRDHIRAEAVGTSSVIDITGTGSTRRDAMDLTRAAVNSLTAFVRNAREEGETQSGEPTPPGGLIVLSPAESEGQVSPTPLRNFLIALNVGILIGLLLALALGRNRLRSDPRHIAAELGVPLLASVDRGGRGGDRAISAAQRLLEVLHARRGGIVVLLTGTATGDHIAQVAERLVGSLGLGTNKRALLVDGDLAGRAMTWRLGLADRPGVSDCLTLGGDSEDLADSIVPLSKTNGKPAAVAVLPAGPPADGSVVMDASRFSSVLDPLKDEFDFVVITGPSVGKTAEVLALLPAAQYCLLVTDGTVSPGRLEAARVLSRDARPGAMGVIGMYAPRRWLRLPSSTG